MKLSGRQKRALEKITGKPWDSFDRKAIDMYFDATDRGILCELATFPEQAINDFQELYFRHKHHGWEVKDWARDFKSALLSLLDFLEPEWDGREYPEAFVEHAFEIYENTMGFIPSCYRGHPKTPLKYRLGI